MIKRIIFLTILPFGILHSMNPSSLELLRTGNTDDQESSAQFSEQNCEQDLVQTKTSPMQLLPNDIIKEIIKIFINRSYNERQLSKNISCLNRINKFFNLLANDPKILACAHCKFEEIKKTVLMRKNWKYQAMPIEISIDASKKQNLQKRMAIFNRAKDDFFSPGVSLFKGIFLYDLNVDLAWLALCNGANVNMLTNKYGLPSMRDNAMTILMHAVIKRNKEIVRILIQKNALLELKDKFDKSAADYAAELGYIEILKLLIESGAQFGNCLFYAANKGKKEVIDFLISYGANINADKNGYTPLMAAAKFGDKEIVQTLLENKAEIFKKDNNGKNVFHYTKNKEISRLIKGYTKNKSAKLCPIS